MIDLKCNTFNRIAFKQISNHGVKIKEKYASFIGCIMQNWKGSHII